MKIITEELILKFRNYLIEEEKAKATVEKYIRDVCVFSAWLGDGEVNKAKVMEYKLEITEKHAPASVNSMLSSINSFFMYHEWYECKVKSIKIQRQIFASEEKELTKEEYERLLRAAKAKNNERLYLLMQTICSGGIRVSELKWITVEAVKKCIGIIRCKGKLRKVYLPKELCTALLNYAKECNIKSGSIFITKNGKPLDRSNIWRDMKKLCAEANVPQGKVFPHNLRHLFARTYYSIQKDIVRLADILGHSSVNTTRIYTMETGEVHRRQIEKLGLVKLRI